MKIKVKRKVLTKNILVRCRYVCDETPPQTPVVKKPPILGVWDDSRGIWDYGSPVMDEALVEQYRIWTRVVRYQEATDHRGLPILGWDDERRRRA